MGSQDSWELFPRVAEQRPAGGNVLMSVGEYGWGRGCLGGPPGGWGVPACSALGWSCPATEEGRAWPADPGGRAGRASFQNHLHSQDIWWLQDEGSHGYLQSPEVTSRTGDGHRRVGEADQSWQVTRRALGITAGADRPQEGMP